MKLLSKKQILRLPSRRYNESGVYFLLDGEEILYIGASGNIHRRLACHSSAKLIPYTRFTFLALPYEEMWETEFQYIKAFAPKHNLQYNPNVPVWCTKQPHEKMKAVAVCLLPSHLGKIKTLADDEERSISHMSRILIEEALTARESLSSH